MIGPLHRARQSCIASFTRVHRRSRLGDRQSNGNPAARQELMRLHLAAAGEES